MMIGNVFCLEELIPPGVLLMKEQHKRLLLMLKSPLPSRTSLPASPLSPLLASVKLSRESPRFNWVINLINDTFGLKTKGEHFLALDDIKFDFSGGFTYMQAYMQVKDFICSGLLAAGSRFEGKQYTNTEVLSPVAKNFITKNIGPSTISETSRDRHGKLSHSQSAIY